MWLFGIKKRHLFYLIIFNLLCASCVRSECDDDKKKASINNDNGNEPPGSLINDLPGPEDRLTSRISRSKNNEDGNGDANQKNQRSFQLESEESQPDPTPSSLAQKLQRNTGSALGGRFPVFPFRTKAGVLDSTLQGKVKILEPRKPLVEIRTNSTAGTTLEPEKKRIIQESEEIEENETNLPSSSTTAISPSETSPSQKTRGSKSINFGDDSSSSDLNNLPSSDQPFLQDDEFQESLKDGTTSDDFDLKELGLSDEEMQTPQETSNMFSKFGGNTFRTLKSAVFKALKGKSSASPTSSSYLSSYNRPPKPTIMAYKPLSRPTLTTIVIPPTSPRPTDSGDGGLVSLGGGIINPTTSDEDGFSVPTFPSSSSSGGGGGSSRPTSSSLISGGGGGGGNTATIVPILGGGGARTRSSNFDLDDDEPEFLENDDDYGDESVTDRISPSASPLRSRADDIDSRRAGRTRSRVIGSGNSDTSSARSSSGPIKPIRRLVGSSGTRFKASAPTTSSASLGSLLSSRAKLKASSQKSSSADDDIIRDFVFSDIKCFRTRQKEYFGTTIYLKNEFHLPYIRDRPQDPLSSSSCRMESMSAANTYQMTITDLRGCGVEQCGDQNMCLTMVFPKVPTLALAEDEVTTIKCTPQKNTMSEIRTISFAGDSLDNRRSSSTVEGGTQEFAAEVGVFRQNPGTNNGLYVKRVNSGGVVKLGEPLQLRSVVRGGDGWAYSKLTDVKVWRMRDGYKHSFDRLNPNDASEVMTLVDSRGCRNADYQVIADSHPLRDPRNDLVHHFTFKAFLFRGQRSNEPLIVTAKVQACQDLDGCTLGDCESGARSLINEDLEEDDENVRVKRSPVEINNISSIVHDWSTQMALRVVGPKDESTGFTDDDFLTIEHNEDDDDEKLLEETYSASANGRNFHSTSHDSCLGKMIGSTFAGSFIMLLCCTLGLTMVTFCKRSRRRSSRRDSDQEAAAEIQFHRTPSRNNGIPPAGASHNNNSNDKNSNGNSSNSNPAANHPILKRQQQDFSRKSTTNNTERLPVGKRNSGFTSKHKPLPLPPIPTEATNITIDESSIFPSSSSSIAIRSSEKLSKSKVAKLLEQLNLQSSNNKSRNGGKTNNDDNETSGEEYECIPNNINNIEDHDDDDDDEEEESQASSRASSNNSSIIERKSNNKGNNNNENVYIVYYCNKDKKDPGNKKHVRSTSAPPSLRLRKKQRPGLKINHNGGPTSATKSHHQVDINNNNHDDGNYYNENTTSNEQEEDDNEDQNQNQGDDDSSNIRRTVRSVKRNTRRPKGLDTNNNHVQVVMKKGGSFPSRIYDNNNNKNYYNNNHRNGNNRNSKDLPANLNHTVGHRKSVNFMVSNPSIDDDETSTTHLDSSAEDSAYSGSTSCSAAAPIIKPRGGGGTRNIYKNVKNSAGHYPLGSTIIHDNGNANDIFGRIRHHSSSKKLDTGPSATQQELNHNPPGNNQSMTHFVTRNESSTQIIIIPETNV